MPIYNFICETCGKSFDRQLSFSEIDQSDLSIACPNGHLKVRRVFSVPQVVFKGSGWYSKDNAKTNHSSSSGD